MSTKTISDEELKEDLTTTLIEFERKHRLDHKKLASLLTDVLEGIEMNLQGGSE